jgi:hypothetical protein
VAENWEKLGLFYLGRAFDAAEGEVSETPTLYDARDLTTHAVCVGMTGSGKTGLCIGLLEEAAIDGVPAIAVDLKGDIANLLLTFPELAPRDFEPWVLAEDARRKGLELPEYAAREASKWREGLASWGQTPERIARLKDAAEFTVYTPGSSAGLPISILSSFKAPGAGVIDDPELLAERVSTTVAGVLGLIGVEADPVRSRETILLAQLLTGAWSEGRDVDLATLIGLVQSPPFERVGVLDLEAFYPQKDRFGLAMQLNNLLASPTFASWMEGDALDVDALLYTPEGKPRVSIVSIAHLAPAERMFFLTLLLNETLGWMRRQSGTTNLRALLYIDEIFGYLPPTAAPPSKKPMLTLLKQARAFGLGLVLATQNPVDIDYKALSNAGTWFIGRLQTERDKLRILEALKSASATAGAGFDASTIDRILSSLGKRVFLLHNVHESAPQVFQTRWAMSYLRGPMTRTEIKQLMDPIRAARAARQATIPAAATRGALDSASLAAPSVPPTPGAAAVAGGGARAPLPPGYLAMPSSLPSRIVQGFAPITEPVPPGCHLAYRPCLLGDADVLYSHTKSGIVEQRPVGLLVTFSDGPVPVDWSRGIATRLRIADCETSPNDGAWFVPPPSPATASTSFTAWKRGFVDYVYREHALEVLHAPSLGVWGTPGEDERSLRIRLGEAVRSAAAAQTDALRERYASKLRKAEDAIEAAERRVQRERGEASRASTDAWVTAGTGLLGTLFGGRRSTRTMMTTANRAQRQKDDVREAEARLRLAYEEHARLEREVQSELAALAERMRPDRVAIERERIVPKKKDVAVVAVALCWLPVAVQADGSGPILLARAM